MKTFAFLLVVVVGAAFVATVAGEDTAAETTKAADAAAGKAAGGGGVGAQSIGACFQTGDTAKADAELDTFDGKLSTADTPSTTVTCSTTKVSCKVTFSKNTEKTKWKASAHECDETAVTEATNFKCTGTADSIVCHYKDPLASATMLVPPAQVTAFKAAAGPPPPPPPPTTPGGPVGPAATTGGGSPEESLAVSIKASMTIVFLTVLASSVSALAGPSV